MVFSSRTVQRGYQEKTEARTESLKGAVVQTGLEPGNREIATVRSRYQAITSEDNACWKRLSVIL
jgi:hypothetical protein